MTDDVTARRIQRAKHDLDAVLGSAAPDPVKEQAQRLYDQHVSALVVPEPNLLRA